MRAYRFVNALGSAAESAGRAVADAADVTAEHRGGLTERQATGSTRIGEELLRQIARHTEATTLERADIEARTVTTERNGQAGDEPGLDVALSIHVDLPSYETTNVALGTVVHSSQLPADPPVREPTPVRERLQAIAERTPAAVLLLVEDDGTRVIPAQSVLGLSEPVRRRAIDRHLYGRSLGRFVEELAEGFVGVDTLDPDTTRALDPGRDDHLRSWMGAQALEGVCALRIGPTRDQTVSTLSDFRE
ncbi:MAG: hypothetical protein ABEJ60_03170 [Halodesulfurarchaeum sp.]